MQQTTNCNASWGSQRVTMNIFVPKITDKECLSTEADCKKSHHSATSRLRGDHNVSENAAACNEGESLELAKALSGQHKIKLVWSGSDSALYGSA